jgi:uncharacterized RDD family membrane protein YckC
MIQPILHPKSAKSALVKRFFIVLFLVAFLSNFSSGALASDSIMPQMWAKGNDQGVYLVVTETDKKGLGFRIYIRPTTSDHFTPGSRYAGQPLALVLHEKRLMIFLDGGVCQSYDLFTGQTERRLPAGLIPISCSSQSGQLLVLAKATQPVRIEMSDTYESLLMDQNDWTLLTLDDDRHWKSFSHALLPLKDMHQPTIAAINDNIHLFALTETDSSALLLHAQIIDHHLTELQPIPYSNPIAATPMIVNKQLRLVIQTLASSISTDPLYQSVLAWQNNGQWTFSSPLLRQDQEQLLTGPDNLTLTNMDQMIIAFEQTDPEQITYGFYRSDGQIEQPLTQEIPLVNRDMKQWVRWLSGREAEMIVLIIVLTLLYLKRQDAFFDQTSFPESFVPAPFWRRGLAWFLDFFPVTLISWLITIGFYPELKTLIDDQNFLLAQPENMHGLGHHEALTILFLVTTFLFVIYQIAWESLLGASPGKKVLRLQVIDYKGHRPGFKQIFLRNIFRVFETLPMIILLLLLFTRRRQRIGDLMAQTIIAIPKPNSYNTVE